MVVFIWKFNNLNKDSILFSFKINDIHEPLLFRQIFFWVVAKYVRKIVQLVWTNWNFPAINNLNWHFFTKNFYLVIAYLKFYRVIWKDVSFVNVITLSNLLTLFISDCKRGLHNILFWPTKKRFFLFYIVSISIVTFPSSCFGSLIFVAIFRNILKCRVGIYWNFAILF